MKALYIGWLGHKNVGDDFLVDIFRQQLSLNNINWDIDKTLANSSIGDLREYDLIILGGGSLLTVPYYIELCLKASKLGIPYVIWGTGVDNRDKGISTKIYEDLVVNKVKKGSKVIRLDEVVEKANLIGVRGNITKAILNNDKAKVIGDPGISFSKFISELPTVKEIEEFCSDQKDIVVVNWGTSYNNIFGKSEAEVEKELERAVREILNQGYKVIVYPIWSEDIKVIKSFVDKFENSNIMAINQVYDADEIAAMIDKAKFTINLKLHANIISMTRMKPFISLAYGLKCYDFAQSIDSMELIIPTDEVTQDRILDKVVHIKQNYEQIQNKFQLMIDKYYKRQMEYVKSLSLLSNYK
ncbi:polysaccharide pyruvyl transferase family protein [Orenia marismortui]|uniref:Polysaccharide pyruvyl transferase WcaK-like protein n=1 Tax=Orenia marismortui TaxID=46469 RepID=A0A4R8H8W4_9FIRM|nr:polysaccharide pyruvyl transferase family protein [Orenia marismortui]TDX52356.1 polysaccharide pyruvyl transferase WcaK-like protein [Orenia marismortui]